MITTSVRAAFAAAALAVLPFLATAPAAQAQVSPAAGAPILRGPLTLVQAIRQIPVADEQRAGYKRELYKHWNRGLDPADGCDTRREVILSEAVEAPTVAAGCKLSGGSWSSPYDGITVTDAGGLDVDHMVPLAEVHDSGGYAWTPARREAYANDQGSTVTLIAVTAKSNRSKADKDPAQWLPPADGYRCQYAADWTATKLRWQLTANDAEQTALLGLAGECPTTTVTYDPAP
ncbi:HNH endonuclease family protein (plasmid) [Streptomyces sp. NBC_01335]|uniref:HNH endonuclease family protein n=1 Tax=Streptomyces sp. NBC_01335 TaxID=2903828 RepID=UPI002E15325B|nr:HNH endonuclease family protein [Streptomyces sp. NBC_01335]